MSRVDLPQQVYLYTTDCDADGNSVWRVATSAADIPSICNGQRVGVFILQRKAKFSIKAEIK